MQDYDEIRRRFLAGESQRHIAKAMGIPRNTVKNTVKEMLSPGNGKRLTVNRLFLHQT